MEDRCPRVLWSEVVWAISIHISLSRVKHMAKTNISERGFCFSLGGQGTVVGESEYWVNNKTVITSHLYTLLPSGIPLL